MNFNHDTDASPVPLELIDGATPMSVVEASIPGARRALFSAFHIGGCSSCGFAPTETLAEVCQRNENLSVEKVLKHLRAAHDHDLAMLIEPLALKAELEGNSPPRLIDIRSREEYEAVRIAQAVRFTEELRQEAFGSWPKDSRLVICDHKGPKALDAAAFFAGHGFDNVKALAGGIDRFAQEADVSLPRYQVEFE